MPILISQQILDRICAELSNITESFTLISAYCKTPLVEYLDTFIDRPLVKNLIVRLKPEDILAGATDLELYPYCKEHGWSMFFRLDLHAKTYIFDNLRCVLGSANATSRGLSIGGVGNYEMAVLNEIDDSDRQQVRNLFRSSVRMTDALYADMKTAISSMESQHTPRASAKWPEEINQFFHPDFSLLFSEDFPSCFDPREATSEDLIFLNTFPGADQDEIKKAFRESKCFQWLMKLLSEQEHNELYFGAASAALHSVILNDPRPYRKEVKNLLANLLNWISVLDMEEIGIDRPNYSQRIFLR